MFAYSVAKLGRQLDGACIAREEAMAEAASAASAAVHAIIISGVLEVDLYVEQNPYILCPHNTLCMHLALSQMKDAKRACYGLKSELSKLKQQQQQQPQAQPQQLLSQETMQQQQRQKSPQQAVKVSTPCPSPSAAVAAAAAAATAAAAAEHEAVLSHLRSRLSAADALAQASCSMSCGVASCL